MDPHARTRRRVSAEVSITTGTAIRKQNYAFSYWNLFGIAVASFTGCLLTAIILHEPFPRIHDEFSYILMGDTFAHGRLANPMPPVPEFFDTFHVLIHPVYASKYFPAQGLFLALGQQLTGRPAVGVWISSALACWATTWMLRAWIAPSWALLGGFLMLVQYGVFSYWSQSYWGGMVPALGGALLFGALRRLWYSFSSKNALCFALGILLLASSRPLEGFLAALPATYLFLRRLLNDHFWRESRFWTQLVLPMTVLLAPGVMGLATYNRAITGLAGKTPYILHEQQYQESPPLLFLAPRPQLTYSSYWLGVYYHVHEMQAYLSQREPKFWCLATGRKIATWWDFYCGGLLSIPLFVPGVLQRGKTRICQIVFLTGFGLLPFISGNAIAWRILIDLLFLLQIGVLWFVFNDYWSRVAIATSTLTLFASFFTKWFFPHYFAPAASLILFLEVVGLRRIWNWCGESNSQELPMSRGERRRLARQAKTLRNKALNLRWLIYTIPIACTVWLVLRVGSRANGWWNDDPHDLARETLLMDDWSVDRARIDRWLEQQPTPQLVFVRYSPRHNVINEWVYNHADIMRSHVIWARDLGEDHNKLLLHLLSDRTVWLIEADRRRPQLIPYSDTTQSSGVQTPPRN